MPKTFFFYDLETSGLSARRDRIMQFAGQRTDLDLNPIDDPINELVRLNNDTIPSPEALLVTGITPQKTVEDGWSEAEFASKLVTEWFTPDTIIVGFNSIRFDDEFVRHLLWRNFYDPYEWSWKDGRSRWDMLDVVRMTRALRPEGIEWPINENGEPTNRLELITKQNNISHESAHDALSDVFALIDVAKLIKQKQPQLFEYLLKIRDKKEVQRLVNLEDKKPFVYTSGRYDNKYQKTTVAFPLTSASHGNVLVYDLRHDPSQFVNLSQDELEAMIFASKHDKMSDNFVPIPIKQLQYNRCPAVAPLGVLEQSDGWKKISLNQATVEKNIQLLLSHPGFAERVRTAFEKRPVTVHDAEVEARLYDGFLSEGDRMRVEAVRNANAQILADFQPNFTDERLPELLLHYKARNFPQSLSESEMTSWEAWRNEKINHQLLEVLELIKKASQQRLSDEQQFVLDELQLWIGNTLS